MFEINIKSEKILLAFKNLHDSYSPDQKKDLESAFHTETHFIMALIKNESCQNKQVKYIEECDRIFQGVTKTDYYWNINQDKSMLSILMNLSMIGDDKLTKWSIQLLYSLHSQHLKLRDTFLGMQLIDSKSEEEYKKISRLASHLRRLGETSEEWYVEKGERGKQENQECKYILKELNRFLEIDNGEYDHNANNRTQFIDEPEGEESNPGTRNTAKEDERLDFVYLDQIKKIN